MAKRTAKNPATGCRPAQLFGGWAILPDRMRELGGVARTVDLVALRALRSGPTRPRSRHRSSLADDYGGRETDDGYALLDGGVALIEISGPMTKYETSFSSLFGGCSTLAVRRQLRLAVESPLVRSVMLLVDSPGGTVAGTDELARAVAEAAAGPKRVAAFIEDCGASAAYWVASQASRVYANASAMVGSIGTYCVLTDTTGRQEQDGVRLTTVSSAPAKGLGADGAVTDEVVAEAARQVGQLNELFVAAVAAGRGFDPEEMGEVADGRVHVGRHALGMGLVDELASFDAAVAALRSEDTPMAKSSATRIPPAKPARTAAKAAATLAGADPEKDKEKSAAGGKAKGPAKAAKAKDDEKDEDEKDEGDADDEGDEDEKDKAAGDDEDDEDDEERAADGGDDEDEKAGGKAYTGKEYVKAFGDVGGRWYVEGKPFHECVAQHNKDAAARHKSEVDAKDKEIARLQAVVDASPRGDKGVGFNAADAGPSAAAKQYAGKLSDGTARFAAGIKLPGASKN